MNDGTLMPIIEEEEYPPAAIFHGFESMKLLMLLLLSVHPEMEQRESLHITVETNAAPAVKDGDQERRKKGGAMDSHHMNGRRIQHHGAKKNHMLLGVPFVVSFILENPGIKNGQKRVIYIRMDDENLRGRVVGIRSGSNWQFALDL